MSSAAVRVACVLGTGLLDGFGVRLGLVVFGEGPVDAGDAWAEPLRLPVGMIRSGWDLLDRLAVRAAPEHGVQHGVGDDLGPAAMLALAGRGVRNLALVTGPGYRAMCCASSWWRAAVAHPKGASGSL